MVREVRKIRSYLVPLHLKEYNVTTQRDTCIIWLNATAQREN